MTFDEMVQAGYNPRLLAFLKVQSHFVTGMPAKRKLPAIPPITKDQLEKLSALVTAYPAGDDPFTKEAAAIHSESLAAQLACLLGDMAAVEAGKLPTLKAIFADPLAAGVPDRMHHQYVVASALSHAIDTSNVDVAATYLVRLAPDLMLMAVHNAIRHNPALKEPLSTAIKKAGASLDK